MKKINADRIVSVSAIVVSIASLIMIFYQTNLMRRAQVSSVMPSLAVGYSVNEEDGEVTEKVWLANRGLGPAFIEQVAIIKEDERFDTDPIGFLKRMEYLDGKSLTYNRLHEGVIIPADDGMPLCEKVTDSTSTFAFINLFKFPYDIKGMPSDAPAKAIIEITYKSIYGDRWMVRSDSAVPVEL